MGKRQQFDWEAIDREVRAGQLSLREIGRKFGPSEAAIRKRMKKHGISRDLSARIRAGVRAKVAQPSEAYTPAETEKAVTEGIERGAQVVTKHQRLAADLYDDIAFMRRELRAAITGVRPDDGEAATDGTRRILISKGDGAASLLHALTASAERVIRMERQAYALDADREDDKDYERELEAARARVAAGVQGANGSDGE